MSIAAIEERLASYRKAEKDISEGAQAYTITSPNGGSVTFQRADLNVIRQQIRDLEFELERERARGIRMVRAIPV